MPVRSGRSVTPLTPTSRSSDATGSAASSPNTLRSHEVTHFRAPTRCRTGSEHHTVAAVVSTRLAVWPTELGSHNKPEVRNEMIDPCFEQTEVLAPGHIADGIAYPPPP